MLRQKNILLSVLPLLVGYTSTVYATAMVSISEGEIHGITESGIDVFKGIPYAKPPVGDLRWRAPQPMDKWSGVLDATQYGHDCMQEPFPSDAAPLGTEPAENCLVLNVWKPHKKVTEKLPVMVWIYGGGFVNGGSSPDIYNGESFAKNNIITVSFNYRVGRFGFFAHPALSAENKDGVLGNYGFMDQIAALKWVNNNIRQFGGDPENITVVGESAGGFSIHNLLTSSMSEGLFNKAIIQSGGGRTAISSRHLSTINKAGQASAESVGVNFAVRKGIQGTGSDALEKLRRLSATDVVSGLNMATMSDPTYAGPMVDGKLVKKQLQEYYSAGEKLNVPLLLGTTDHEIGFAPTVSNFDEALKPIRGTSTAIALATYKQTGLNKPQTIAQAISSDFLMVEPARFVMREAVKQGQTVYGYRFAYVADSLKKQWAGAYHATDIPYAFNTVDAKYKDELTENDREMATLIHQYWVNFIRYGNPNGSTLPQWTPYRIEKDNIMLFSNKGRRGVKMISDPWAKRLDIVESSRK